MKNITIFGFISFMVLGFSLSFISNIWLHLIGATYWISIQFAYRYFNACPLQVLHNGFSPKKWRRIYRNKYKAAYAFYGGYILYLILVLSFQ